MRHLPVDALLLFSVSSASSILPELQDRIRGLVGKVDLLVDLVDLHSGLVGGPGDQGPGDQDVKQGWQHAAAQVAVESGESRADLWLKIGNMDHRPPGGPHYRVGRILL